MNKRLTFVIILGLSNLILLLPPLRPLGAILLTLVLPGWGWSQWFLSEKNIYQDVIGRGKHLSRFNLNLTWGVLTLGFSFAFTILLSLGLHYLPGPITTSMLLVALNALALLPLPFIFKDIPLKHIQLRAGNWPVFFLCILLPALFLRMWDIGYSEFQGDEALAMITAAEAIEGHENALFLRGKGPGEVLLPLAIWRLTGPITEGLARVPFALAGLAGVITLYLVALNVYGLQADVNRIALYAAGFLALSGFMVGFSRIVQYQTLVIWFSTLSIWAFWQWHQFGRQRGAFLSGFFLGAGVLAHYDAILVIPMLGWIWFSHTPYHFFQLDINQNGKEAISFKAVGLWFFGFLSSSLPFYIPYYLDPQSNRTGSYLADRIGEGWLKNNLADFFHFNSFYSSFYYLLIGWGLLGFFLIWAVYRTTWPRLLKGGAILLTVIGLMLPPALGGVATGIIWALILAIVFLSPTLLPGHRPALVWFAVPFWGYNFAVGTPLTHIYTTLPGWALLAGWSLAQLEYVISDQLALKPEIWRRVMVGALVLSYLYLWHAFVRHDVEFLQDYPASQLALYQTPYNNPPATGFFGFAHKTGWKAIGALQSQNGLQGDYGSNEEEDVTSWYTHHAPRACDPGANLYFIASDLVDPIPLPPDLEETHAQIGEITLPNNKTLTILEQQPTTLNLDNLNLSDLEADFNRGAFPALFTRTPTWQTATEANFGGQIQLVGYTLDTTRAYPGGRILLTLYWQLRQPVNQSYKVFVHLDSDKKYAQADSYPTCSRYPTDLWRPGEIVADQHALHLAADTPLTELPLVVGLYVPENGQHLDVLDVAGNPAGVSTQLTTITISKK